LEVTTLLDNNFRGISGIILTHFKPLLYITNFNDEPDIRLLRTTL